MAVGSDPRPGSELAGFRLEELLGRGGMGAVYRAEDVRLGRRVALKLLAPALAEDTRFRERFLRESQLAASLEHPNIVPIYAAGEVEGQLYLAMRFVDGYDLRHLIAREGPLEPSRVLGLLDQVADALDAAHGRGLIHRDVKPGNVLIAGGPGREHCYLADFGLTKQTSSISGLTGTGELVGTVAYVSPEQIRGETVDARADVYALGCVLYECLAGEPPFARETDVATLWAHVNEDSPSLRAARPELGGEIDGVLARALAKNPADRHESCGELVGAATAALRVVTAASAPAWHPRARRIRRRSMLLATGGVAVVLIAAAVALALLVRGGDGLSSIGPTSVGVIDPATNELVADIHLGFTSGLIASGEGFVWVVNPKGRTLIKIDPRTMKIASTDGIPRGGIPVGLAAGEGSVWVAMNQVRRLVVLALHPEFTEVRHSTPLETAGATPFSIESETVNLAVGSGAVWALEHGREEVTRIDPSTGKGTRVAEGKDGKAIAVSRGSVWLGGLTGVTRLDPETGTELAFAPVPNVADAESTSIAVGPGAVWFAGSSQQRIWRLTQGGDILDSSGIGARPSALAVDAKGIVWAASGASGSVVRFDPRTESPEPIDLGSAPAGVVADFGRIWTSPGGPVR